MTNNPAAMTERLIDAAIFAETASGPYVSAARKEVSDARADIEAAVKERDRLREALAKALAAIDGTARQLDRWADESRSGGWSTHQVEPNRHHANMLRRAADQARALTGDTP